MTVRAKFRVDGKEDQPGNPEGVVAGTVYLSPVIDGSEENKQFYHYTPGGQITLSTVNPDAYKQFEVGTEFYVDFTPANELSIPAIGG